MSVCVIILHVNTTGLSVIVIHVDTLWLCLSLSLFVFVSVCVCLCLWLSLSLSVFVFVVVSVCVCVCLYLCLCPSHANSHTLHLTLVDEFSVGGEDVEFVRCGHRECMLIVHGVGGAITITVKYVPRSISFDTVKHWMPVR